MYNLLLRTINFTEQYRFRLLFLANIAFTVALSIPVSGYLIEMATFLFFQGSAIIALKRSKNITILVAISFLNLLICLYTNLVTMPSFLQLNYLHNTPVILLYIVTSVIMFRHVVNGASVTSEILYGLGALYLQIGLVFAFFYDFVEHIHPGSIVTPIGLTGFDSLVYFSIVTLTTLGYGDIQAVTPVARLLVCTESIFGVLFIAIIVSRIMSALNKD
ncbi:ion channel [Klebsiella variicola]